MRKLIILLVLSFVFIVGCVNESTENHPEQASPTDETETPEEKEEQAATDTDKETSNESQATETTTKPSAIPTALPPLTVHYIDAGQGDAALLTFTDEEDAYAILFDAGDWRGNEVVPYLQNVGVDYLDIVIISHPHADHIGQLDDVLAAVDVGEVWMTGNTANSGIYERAAEAILQSDADYDEPTAGDIFDIGPLTIEILHPNNLTGKLNEDSLAALFTYGDIEFLFTGDAYIEQENAILSRKKNLKADFIQLGHHGSKTSSGKKFLEAVAPTYAIYSAGTGNSYGHPHQEVLDRLQTIGVKVYGTDVHGNIVVTTDGSEAEVSTDTSGSVTAGQQQNDSNDTKSTANKNSSSKASPEQKQPSSSNCIDINQASAEQLQGIIHIGEKRAIDVIELRPFGSVNDLQRIDGIGPARIKDIKAEQKACVGGN